jgi:hypothetical protein
MLKSRSVVAAVALMLASGLCTTLSALDIRRAKTEAEIGLDAAGAQALQVRFRADLANDGRGVPDLTRERVVVGWQTAGGVDPTPFRVLIPAGCFVPNAGFHVGDFRACGVQLLFGRTALPIADFEASFRVASDGRGRLIMETIVPLGGIEPTPFLGALGGSVVGISIGSESGRSFPVSTGTVSGVEPVPF